MASLNKFRSENVTEDSHNKLHVLTLCTIIVFNMTFEWLAHICTPHIKLFVRSPNRAVNFKHRFNHKDLGDFLNASWRRAPIGSWVKKSWHWVINCTLDDLSMHPVTTKIQASFLTQLPERKETAQGFHHENNCDFKTVTAFNGCDRRKLRMDQQHCSYSTILT